MRRRPEPQLALALPQRGGRRRGAGRKPSGESAGVSHAARERISSTPVHITLRCCEDVPNLRTRASFPVVARALRAIHERAFPRQGTLFFLEERRSFFRVVHFSVQPNHLHLIVEASDASALANGVNAFSCRMAKGLNALHGRTGKVFSDRYHAHVLRTPTGVTHAVRYALHNAISHARRRGELVDPAWRDPYSSASVPDTVRRPETWLLRRAAIAA